MKDYLPNIQLANFYNRFRGNPAIKEKKVKLKELADFFGCHEQSVGNWKNSDNEKLNNRYKALELYYRTHLDDIACNKIIEEAFIKSDMIVE